MSHWKRSVMAGAVVIGAALFAVPFASAHSAGVIGAQLAGSARIAASTQQSAQTTSTGSSAVSRAAAASGRVAAGSAATGVSAAAAGGSGQDHRTGGTQSVGCNDGTITYSPTTIWPPNHRMVTINISYLDADQDGDSTTITVNSVSDNETVGGVELNGSGQPTAQQGPDWMIGAPGSGSDPSSGSATPANTSANVRAERSGTGDGRVYDIKVTCTDTGATGSDPQEDGPMVETHQVDLYVTVPHDQGKN